MTRNYRKFWLNGKRSLSNDLIKGAIIPQSRFMLENTANKASSDSCMIRLRGKMTPSINQSQLFCFSFGTDFIRNSRRKFTEQETLDYMAATIKVNLKFSSKVTAEITFTNNGSRAIRNSRWAIYASTHLRFTPSSTMEDNAGVEEAIQIRLTHVNGCLYKFEPGVKNLKISPGESVKCKVKTIPFKVTTRFLVSPNWYIAAEGLKPKTITSTADEEVTFVSFPQAPLYRRISEITPDLGHATLPVVPTPKQVTTSRNSNGKNTKVYISKEWTVSADDRLQNEREFLSGNEFVLTYQSNCKFLQEDPIICTFPDATKRSLLT